MKLLYVFPEEFSGRFAREYHVYRLAESLAAAGCEVTLVAAPSAKISRPEHLHDLFGGTRSERLQIVWLKREVGFGPLKIRSGAWFFRQLDRLLPRLDVDIAYTMHLKAADHLERYHNALPLVFEAHEIFSDSYPPESARHRQLLELERRIYQRLHGVVAISSYLAETLWQRFGLRLPVHVQHDGIDPAMLLEPGMKSDPHELIYAGSLQPWKGVPVAVEAMRLLPEYRLTVIGGSSTPLERLRRDAPGNVAFLGQMSREALRPHLQRAAIGLMPNLLEPRSALYTFPLKLLEYAAAGKGIVASKIPAFDHLDVYRWTELVPSGSAEALATGVKALAQRGVEGKAGQNWARQFLWEHQGVTMKQFLESVLR